MFSVDLRSFNKAIDLRESRGSKTLTDIQNNALRNVAYRSAQFTEVTAAAKVNADLRKPGLLARLTAIRLRGRKVADFKVEMQRTRQLKLASVRYLRSGFAPIIRALGGKFRGGRSTKLDDKFQKSQSGIHSTAKLATGARAAAAFTWIIDEPTDGHAKSAEAEVFPSIQRALDFVAADMIAHDLAKLEKSLQ